MIIKMVAYENEFAEDLDTPFSEFRCDEDNVEAMLEVMNDFLASCQVELPVGYKIGLEEEEQGDA